jgi:hypothetical protein|eukprot:COSAG06_NODE_2691_length_6430_cov_2.427648_11_plen_81_part_00
MLVCETYCVGRYYETTSWIDTARSTANCSSQGAKVRITQVSANNTKQNKTLLPAHTFTFESNDRPHDRLPRQARDKHPET